MLKLKEKPTDQKQPAGVAAALAHLDKAAEHASAYEKAVQEAAHAWTAQEAAVDQAVRAMAAAAVVWPHNILTYAARVKAGDEFLHKVGQPSKMPGHGRIEPTRFLDLLRLSNYGDFFRREVAFIKRQVDQPRE